MKTVNSEQRIGGSRLNIRTTDNKVWNMSNIQIHEDWLTQETLSIDKALINDNYYDHFMENIMVDISLMKHPKTGKNGIFITSSSLEDTIKANKKRDLANEY